MEKESMDNKCGWCGQGTGLFSWKRLILAVLIGLFIFLAGIQIGTMRGSYGNNGPRMMMHNMRYDNYDEGVTRTIVIPAPAVQTTPAAPAPVQAQ